MTNDQAPMTKQIQRTNEGMTKTAESNAGAHWSLVLGHGDLFDRWCLRIGT
jgi:hypothetical protein